MSFYSDDMSLWPGPDGDWETAAGLNLPWPAGMAFAQIGPDTPHLAAHLAAYGHIDDPDVICACPRCVAERAEAAADVKPCGCPDYVLCLCRKREPVAPSADEQRAIDGSLLEGPEHACSSACPPEPALTPEQEIRAGLEAFDDWLARGGPQLPEWMEPGSVMAEPGRCRECHLGYAAVPGGLCLYCKLRAAGARDLRHQDAAKLTRGEQRILADQQIRESARANRAIARRRGPHPKRIAATGVLGFALLVIASHVPALGMLVVPGIVMIALALAGRRRS